MLSLMSRSSSFNRQTVTTHNRHPSQLALTNNRTQPTASTNLRLVGQRYRAAVSQAQHNNTPNRTILTPAAALVGVPSDIAVAPT